MKIRYQVMLDNDLYIALEELRNRHQRKNLSQIINFLLRRSIKAEELVDNEKKNAELYRGLMLDLKQQIDKYKKQYGELKQ